jgi:predicted transcriptional regulator
MGEPPAGMSIGRKNNNGIYSPNNCRWETPTQQQNNTRANVFGWLNGERLTAAQIARKVGKDRGTIARQIKQGLYGQS